MYATVHPDRQRNIARKKTILPSQSILYTEWSEPDRPYSQKELVVLTEKLYTDLHIVDMAVTHPKCGHSYRIKNGVRYKKLKEQHQDDDVGNCSVCWKISKTPKELQNLVKDFVELHSDDLTSSRHTYFSYTVKNIFYTWLYVEMFE
jgi:hypothetical protein